MRTQFPVLQAHAYRPTRTVEPERNCRTVSRGPKQAGALARKRISSPVRSVGGIGVRSKTVSQPRVLAQPSTASCWPNKVQRYVRGKRERRVRKHQRNCIQDRSARKTACISVCTSSVFLELLTPFFYNFFCFRGRGDTYCLLCIGAD